MKKLQTKFLGSLTFAACLMALSVYHPVVSQDLVAQNTTVEDVAEKPSELFGQKLTLRGAVGRTGSNSSFLLKDEDLFGLIDDAEVLVINQTGALLPARPQEDIELQVTGRVAMLTPDKISQLGLSSVEYSQYTNKAVVFADSIAISISPDELFDNPEAYYYKPVAVKGEIEQVVSPNSFTMEDDEIIDEIFGSRDLLVLGADPEQVFAEDSGVVVTGIVRPLDMSELRNYYGDMLGNQIRSELDLAAEDRPQPVLIANGVYPIRD